jgi:hypothetical protein
MLSSALLHTTSGHVAFFGDTFALTVRLSPSVIFTLDGLMLTLDTCWDKYAPFGSVALQNAIVKPGKDAETMKSPSASCAMKREGDAWKLNTKGFEAESGFGELFEDAVKLFVPKGLKL